MIATFVANYLIVLCYNTLNKTKGGSHGKTN